MVCACSAPRARHSGRPRTCRGRGRSSRPTQPISQHVALHRPRGEAAATTVRTKLGPSVGTGTSALRLPIVRYLRSASKRGQYPHYTLAFSPPENSRIATSRGKQRYMRGSATLGARARTARSCRWPRPCRARRRRPSLRGTPYSIALSRRDAMKRRPPLLCSTLHAVVALAAKDGGVDG